MTEQVKKECRSDREAFFELLPAIVASFATKHTESKTIRELSIGLAREVTASLVQAGICERTTTCFDLYQLAPVPAAVAMQPLSSTPAPLGNGNGFTTQGQMVAQYQTNEVQKIRGI